MARVMLGSSADAYGGYDEESFIKGYEKGFDTGWSFGYRKALEEGRKQGRTEAKAEFKKRAEEESIEGGDECHGEKRDGGIRDMLQAIRERRLRLSADTTSRASGDVCLLSDVALDDLPASSPYCLLSDVAVSPIREEDVFYDAASSFSAESEDLLDVFYDANPSPAASGSESADIETNTEPTELSTRADTPEEPEEEDLLDLSYDNDKSTSVSSPTESIELTEPTEPHNNMNLPTSLNPKSSPAHELQTNHDTFLVPLARTSPLLFSNQHTSDYPPPLTLALTPHPDIPLPSELYTIPLPYPFNPTSNIHPTLPDLSTPPSALRPRPAYPELSDDHNNIYALARQGKTAVEDPWRVLIGPVSEAAMFAWRGDCGKGYIRGKMGGYPVGGSGGGRVSESLFRGGNRGGGFRVGRGGFGRGGWPGEHHRREDYDRGGEGGMNDGGGGGDGGVAFCQMVTDVEGKGYVLAMFESQEKAREAERFFSGYACGGSIMWGWIYREAE